MEEIHFKIAEGDDLQRILRLLQEAALWLEMKNINYWKIWIDPPEDYINWIRKGFENEEFYLVKDNNSIIGCFRLSWNDEKFWGKQSTPAGYIHSFTIDRKLAGNNKGIEVIKMIEKKCKENNRNYLRLDCSSKVQKLKEYYERIGFRPMGETIVKGERLTLYEKEIR
jgi:N-acetylglutamate synthase-like GNAT family acetyltransferase